MLPEETILAVYPSSVACGKTALRPMTLFHIVAMEALGIAYDEVTSDKALIAAWLLSLDAQGLSSVVNPHGGIDRQDEISAKMSAWMARYHISKDAAFQSVAETLRIAFLTYVPKANGGKQETQLTMKGYGWPLEIAEAVMSRYRMSLEDVMSMPMCRLFALMAVGNAANGYGGGPDYYERMQIVAMKRAKVEALKARLKELDKENGNGEQ